jgi:hypothetical protein
MNLGPINGGTSVFGPFHIARAYQSAAAAGNIRPAEAPAGQGSPRTEGVRRLIAGVVPGRINFAGEVPAQTNGALAMYRHPADRLAAATAVHAGRMIDTTA